MKEDGTDSSGVHEVIAQCESVLHENEAVLQVRVGRNSKAILFLVPLGHFCS